MIPGLKLLRKIVYSLVEAHTIIQKNKADAKALVDKHITADPYNPVIPFRKAQK